MSNGTCLACGHVHSGEFGGICIGCPCPEHQDDLGNDPSWTPERAEKLRRDMQQWIAEVKPKSEGAK